jgi:AcrR family transcriptional regulator
MTTTAPSLLPEGLVLSDARRRLFETAIVLFGDEGFHAVSVRDLATALGQQPGALYGHVTSKQELLFELMTLGVQAHRDALKAALLDAGREPDEQVRALTRAHVLLHLRHQALARLTNREARALTDPQRDAVARVRQESEQMFLDVIERGLRLGVLRSDDPLLTVAAIGAIGVRAAEWWSPGHERTPDQIADTYADFAVRLLT